MIVLMNDWGTKIPIWFWVAQYGLKTCRRGFQETFAVENCDDIVNLDQRSSTEFVILGGATNTV